MDRCEWCEGRIWPWQKREEDHHVGCKRTNKLFDEALETMEKNNPWMKNYKRSQQKEQDASNDKQERGDVKHG